MIFSRDTSLEADRVQVEALRRLSSHRRLALVDELNALARNLSLAGLRNRSPAIPEQEIHARFLSMLWGAKLAASALEHRRGHEGHDGGPPQS